jgi:hypothetical protein
MNIYKNKLTDIDYKYLTASKLFTRPKFIDNYIYWMGVKIPYNIYIAMIHEVAFDLRSSPEHRIKSMLSKQIEQYYDMQEIKNFILQHYTVVFKHDSYGVLALMLVLKRKLMSLSRISSPEEKIKYLFLTPHPLSTELELF